MPFEHYYAYRPIPTSASKPWQVCHQSRRGGKVTLIKQCNTQEEAQKLAADLNSKEHREYVRWGKMSAEARTKGALLEVISDDCATMKDIIGHLQFRITKCIGIRGVPVESQDDRDVLVGIGYRLGALREQVDAIKALAEHQMK